MKLNSLLMIGFSGLFLTQPGFSENQAKSLDQLAYMSSSKGSLTQQQKKEDGQILGIIIAIDQNEMGAAHVVVHKKTSQKIRRYASYLYRQHEANLRAFNKLAKETGIEPLPSATSTTLMKQGQEELSTLSHLNNKALETAYINAMVQGHKAGLHLIDTKLFKNASDYQLKTLVMKTRDMIYRHLVRAVAIQKELQ